MICVFTFSAYGFLLITPAKGMLQFLPQFWVCPCCTIHALKLKIPDPQHASERHDEIVRMLMPPLRLSH
jgi:hypothetical protein